MAKNLIPIAKMNGLGNEILVADMRGQTAPLRPGLIRALAQNPGTSFDQLMAIYDYNARPPDIPPRTNGSQAQSASGVIADGAQRQACPRQEARRNDIPTGTNIKDAEQSSAGVSANILIWNTDGTEAGACGNGTRCVAEWLHTYDKRNNGHSGGKTLFHFQTKGGDVTAERLADGRVTVNMGRPDFSPAAIPMRFAPADMSAVPLEKLLPKHSAFTAFPLTCSVLSVGNPHAVFFVSDNTQNLDIYPLDKFGYALEHCPAFLRGINVSLAQVTSPEDIALRVWERGAGLTRACGTAACATAIAANRLGLTGAAAQIHLPGGDLHIALRDDFCFMTGETEYEYGGMLNLETGEFMRAADERACEQD